MKYDPRFVPKNIDWDTNQMFPNSQGSGKTLPGALIWTLSILILVPFIGIVALALICLIQISLAS